MYESEGGNENLQLTLEHKILLEYGAFVAVRLGDEKERQLSLLSFPLTQGSPRKLQYVRYCLIQEELGMSRKR